MFNYKWHGSQLGLFFHHMFSNNWYFIQRIYNIFKNKSIKNDVNEISNITIGIVIENLPNSNGVKTQLRKTYIDSTDLYNWYDLSKLFSIFLVKFG